MPTFEIAAPDGTKYHVEGPDGATEQDALAQVQAAHQPAAPSVGMDVAKQIGSGLVTGVEAIPAAVPSILGLAGKGVQSLIDKYAPNLTDKGAVAQQSELRDLIEKNRNGGIAQYLPQPETTAGEFARTGASFVPAMAGMAGSLGKNIAVGAAAGLASEGAGQIPGIKGTSAEIPARVAGALVGGPAAAKTAEIPAARAARAAVPTAEDLYSAGTEAYKRVHALGVELRPEPMANLAHQIENKLVTEAGVTERNAKPIYDAINTLKEPPVGAVVTTRDFDNLRKELVQATRSAQGSERTGAGIAIRELDNYLANIPASHVIKGDAKAASEIFKEARGNWAAAKRSDISAGRIELAEHNASTANSGANIDNATRQSVKQLIRPNLKGKTAAEKEGFNTPEIAQMNRVARGGFAENRLRDLGNMLGGGKGMYGGLMGIAGGVGAYEGHPEALLPFLIGRGAKMASGALTQRQARILDEMVRSRSPLGGGGILSLPRSYPAPALLPLSLQQK